MNQVGGIAGYQGNYWYNQETGASEGNQETDFQDIIDDTGRETPEDRKVASAATNERASEESRPTVALVTYDLFGVLQNQEPDNGTGVNILA